MDDNLIARDPEVMMGKPTIKGVRLTVELIVEKLEAGETIDDLLEAYPQLTIDAIHAALSYVK